MERSASSDVKDAEIAHLLAKLADLSAEDGALEACRREAEAFDPALSTAGIALDLLAVETQDAGFQEVGGLLDALCERFQTQGATAAAVRISDGRKELEAARRRLWP